MQYKQGMLSLTDKHQTTHPILESPQPPPFTFNSLASLGSRLILIVVHVDSVRLARETCSRNFTVGSDVIHKRLEANVVILWPDVAQHQQVEARAIEVREVVELGRTVIFREQFSSGEMRENVDFLWQFVQFFTETDIFGRPIRELQRTTERTVFL